MSCAINKGSFFEIAFSSTHVLLPRFEALGYILPHFDELTHVAIRGSSTLTTILLCIKHGSSLSSENVCDSWRLHETGLFSSAAVVPQSKSTEFCSSAANVPHSESTEFCSSAANVPQSKSTELCSSAANVPQSESTEFCSSAAVVPQSKSTEI